MAEYRPRIQHQLIPTCRLGPTSCTSFAVAMAGDRATRGKVVPKGCDLRRRTGDVVGGTTLRQNAAALLAGYGIGLATNYYVPFTEVIARLREHRGVVLSIDYTPIKNSPFRGSESFDEGHAIYLNELDSTGDRALVYDPLADGRRNLADGPDWWPVTLLREAAGKLVLGSSGHTVGAGRAWFGHTVATASVAHPTPIFTTDYGRERMIAAAERFTDSKYVMTLAAGQTCYREPNGKAVTRMVAKGDVPYVGHSASGWNAVVIHTGVPYSDKVGRPTVLHVPQSAGKVTYR